ncbi:aerobactin siderophore biosynthesis protein iucB [Coccidioides immitis H538.4]|uniref:Aerobactin siderophore biosynthesis protein iucB n=3 Tax=Coccidioides immitis TaxID=5501 RepID=A0A0J8QWT3_COCIT|nr:aerobactin siderophore biosynthesis protein iucB [Coccidioides immitis RMSCC 2394]KMU77344.1 aerobactin siderophore biosynthesis protein iucB [Coccidioides immitis RMSCC 3703]KMU92603.1 aerobactin siderophore biosynthesis protein iucB [Coccidioides immitis H538.4]
MTFTSKAAELPLVRLPEPYRTKYEIWQSPSRSNGRIFQLRLSSEQDSSTSQPPEPLHNDTLLFSELISSPQSRLPSASDNTDWARACRCLVSFITWDGETAPTVGQIWIIVYAILSVWPAEEYFRLSLSGAQNDQLREEISATGLGRRFPERAGSEKVEDVIISRAAFWQGAASPFGNRPAWVAQRQGTDSSRFQAPDYPAFPLQYTITTEFSNRPVHVQHPVRPAKPARGATIYSRYIPHLDEFFSMVHLDYQDETHLALFHKWQNDPRVAVNWNETGTLEEHREYLRKIDLDPHQMAVLAKFDDNYFAYFEIYWAKEDHMGTYYPALDWDRGRHSLVGDAKFRGPHRAMAWWTSLIHYIFLDEPRTTCVVGEPKATNEPVLGYDAAHGFHIYKWGDLPHKRSAMVRCERIRFFEIVNFGSVTSSGTAKSTKPKL